MVLATSVVDIDHAPTATFATEAYKLSPGPLIPVPVSGSILVPEQLGSASCQGLETPSKVSDHDDCR